MRRHSAILHTKTTPAGISAVELLCYIAGLLVLVFFVQPLLRHPHESDHPTTSCASNQKQLMLGIMQYTQDYDEKYPLSCTNSAITRGWADALYPYVKSRQIYLCPLANATRNSNQNDYTDFWFNNRLSGVPMRYLNRPPNTLVFGDGNDGSAQTDARYHLDSLPTPWLTDTTKPPYRHRGGAFYAFADGHVKWLTPDQITSRTGGGYTFAPH
ncbi:MAG: DUF1559 domain-containing protein [Abitibacteriaceae bacterium]|nr:DUF1559 domain-containing protein [Abditibacteriaceae bacterium]